jgi:membrane-associated protein
MQYIHQAIDFILHLNLHIGDLVNSFGNWAYLVLFLTIFCETGLVIAPFLPGDSLLFAAGAVSAIEGVTINVNILAPILILAAILGDTCNYWIGYFFGEHLFHENSKFLKKRYLDKTHAFFEKYGGKTIFVARFVPIVRTMTPFVAGMGRMGYKKFISYSLFAAIFWVCLILYSGYLFGNIPIVRDHFGIIVGIIILISITPPFIEYVRHKYFKVKQSDD